MEITACVFNMIRFNATDWLSLSSLTMLVLALVITLCHWDDLPKAADAQPLAAVAPKDAAGPPAPPPANPAPAPAPVRPAAVPAQTAPVKPVVPPVKAAPVKLSPVKPVKVPPKSTEPIVVRTSPGGTTTTTRPRLKEGQEPCDTTLIVRTDEARQVVSMEVTTTVKAAPAELKPYNQGGGHHVPSKRAMEGAPGYDAKKALAIPKAELERLGLNHQKITGIQRTEYTKFEKTRAPLTWEAITKIETDVLVQGKMDPKVAHATVREAVQALKESGIVSPVRIPWGK